MKIKKAKTGDIDAIIEIYREAYSDEPYNEKWPCDVLSKKIKEMLSWMKCYLLVDGEEIVGGIFYFYFDWWNGKKSYVEDFFVAKKFQGKGYGTFLFRKVERLMIEDGIINIELDVNKDANAINLYKKLGYSNSNYIKMEKQLK
jgi:aminoglycoside 6'-N-acetyltransferase I